jgi:plastocyanin
VVKKSILWVAMIAIAAVLAGCHSKGEQQSSGSSGYRDSGMSSSTHDTIVEITSSQMFSPREVAIRAGESILWKNNSSDSHTVTDDPTKVANRDNVVLPTGAKAFHSGELKPGKTYRMTFTTPGTYKYVCLMHEQDGRTGIVTVRPMEPESR